VKSVGKEFALAAVACGLLVACTANIRTAAPKQPADVAGATAAATVKEDAPASTPTETQFQTAARENKCADSSFVETHTPLDPQENGYWCWAASAQMVEAFFDNKVKQCVIANDGCVLNQLTCTGNNCCAPTADCCVTSQACLVPGWPPFERRKIKFTRVRGPLKAKDVVLELGCAKRPFVFSWMYKNGGGHIMVAVGYTTIDGEDYVYVNDSAPPNKGAHLLPMPFESYETGDFKHWDDFYELELKP